MAAKQALSSAIGRRYTGIGHDKRPLVCRVSVKSKTLPYISEHLLPDHRLRSGLVYLQEDQTRRNPGQINRYGLGGFDVQMPIPQDRPLGIVQAYSCISFKRLSFQPKGIVRQGIRKSADHSQMPAHRHFYHFGISRFAIKVNLPESVIVGPLFPTAYGEERMPSPLFPTKCNVLNVFA